MPVFLPFRALRPQKDKVAKFSAKTSDFKNSEEVLEDMRSNQESYYYVTKQQLLAGGKKPVEHYFSIGASYVRKKTETGELFRDMVPSYYVYQQIDHKSKRTYNGIIGLVDVFDLLNGTIKKHELTKVVREEYLYKQLHYTEVLGEPVLMGHQHSEAIEELISAAMTKTPEYNFETVDQKEHIVWLVNNSEEMEVLQEKFMGLPAFYIADGHHRCASTIRNYERNPHPMNRYFMVFLMSELQFNIASFHRLLSGLRPEDTANMKEKLREYFKVEDYTVGELFQSDKHSQFGLLSREFSYKLTLVKDRKSSNPEAHLDVTVLENRLLKPVLGIIHPRTDHRLSYMSSLENVNNVKYLLEKRSIDMVISNFPVSFAEVKQIADAGKVMPPKSTYIEPKLRGGMIIQKF